MNKIYQYKNLIFIEADTASGYARPVDADTMTFRKAGSASTYLKYKSDWKLIGELFKTHIIAGNTLKLLKKKTSNATTSNRSISLPIPLLEKLDDMCKKEKRGFSNLIEILILKGLNNEEEKK